MGSVARVGEVTGTLTDIYLSPQPNGKLPSGSPELRPWLAACLLCDLGEHPPLSGLLFPPSCGMELGMG